MSSWSMGVVFRLFSFCFCEGERGGGGTGTKRQRIVLWFVHLLSVKGEREGGKEMIRVWVVGMCAVRWNACTTNGKNIESNHR